MEWLLKKAGFWLVKTVTFDMYHDIKAENKRQRDFDSFIKLMQGVAAKRSIACNPNDTSRDCPMASVIEHYHQKGRTSDGTAPLYIFTIVGSDSQIINIQGFALMQTIKITVRHQDGSFDVEDLDPSEAMKRIRREAGYAPH